MHWNKVWNDAKSFKQHKHSMQRSLKYEASKGDYKGDMQYMAHMHEPIMDRVQIGLNMDQSMLRWRLKGLGMQAYTLS